MKRSFPYTLAVAVAFAAASFTSSAGAETLRSIRAWSQNLGLVKDLYYPSFQTAVTKATNGKLTFQNLGPETAPPFEQFEPLSQGVFDVMLTATTYHQAQTGISVVLSGILNATDSDALTSSGVRAWLNNYYRKNFGVFIVAVYPAGETTFVLRDPLTGDTKLTGRKIRTNAAFEGIVRALGGSPVAMGPADAYAALQKGTLDGVTWPVTATAEFKLYEVTKYMTRPLFSQGYNAVYMNAAKFDSLPKDQQAAILQAGLDLEKKGKSYFLQEAQEQDKIMLQHGIKFTEFSPEVAPQLEKLSVDGSLAIAMRSRPNDVKALLEFARKAGMLVKGAQ